MTIDPMDRTRDVPETPDPALDALLRRHDRGAPPVALGELEARILSAAAFQLASRRRTARTSMADTLAAWVRVALPMAAAAALFATLFLSRMETSTLADAELRESDPAALLSALESDGSSGLAHHVIESDAGAGAGAIELEPR
ncbi:MAG: hypothetical protein V4813_18340 [Gemmatimonadota bacterium]